MKFMKNKKIIVKKLVVFLIILFTLYFVISCNISKEKVLVIQDKTSNKKIEYYLPNCNFSLGYQHSVMKTPVEEFFYVNEHNQIVLEKIVYESYGVGTPFLEEEGELEIIGGKYILKINRTFKEINMIISPIPNHWLTIGEEKHKLNDILEKPNSSIKIYIYQTYRLKSFFNDIF